MTFPTEELGVFCTGCCHPCVPAFTPRTLGDGDSRTGPLGKFGRNRCDGDTLVGVISPGLWTLWSDPEPVLIPELFGRWLLGTEPHPDVLPGDGPLSTESWG